MNLNCAIGDNCVCGGDTPGVRRGCANYHEPSPAELAGQIIELLQAFAKATGCPLGADVTDWYANEHGKHIR